MPWQGPEEILRTDDVCVFEGGDDCRYAIMVVTHIVIRNDHSAVRRPSQTSQNAVDLAVQELKVWVRAYVDGKH
jgi:hypothetical protein